jgi:hypothetical protein
MIFVLIVAVTVAALTWVVGWWGLVVVALVFGVIHRADGGGARFAALGSGLAWLGLLAGNAAGGRLPLVVTTVGGAMGVPGIVVVAITVLFAAAVGWSAAAVSGELARSIGPDPTL